ncbi:septum site-determining protein MinC [Rickettsiella massiliensis]|uniref:septum site-determining protein MinC n=1 Tax=Rickettsiella massiliensis TaxID=676517 RepID=UPI000299E243|nr:septum site-determining protein MinC [Rickettsiella massiliensis]
MLNPTETLSEAFKLKAGLITLTTFYLLNADIVYLEKKLAHFVKQTPQFFQKLPIILEFSALHEPKQSFDFSKISQLLRHYGLIPIGIRGIHPEQEFAAAQAGLAILPTLRSSEILSSPTTPSTLPSSPTPLSPAKIVAQPIRSGQQVYAKNSDLIVLTSVSPGAELLADGNIHIYGRLKGRALAGVNGNQEAHIFCKDLQAELISIAGHYWLNEDLQNLQQKMSQLDAHIFLEQERLTLKNLG